MPKGVYPHRHAGGHPKSTCECGQCALCKQRERRRRHDERKKKDRMISDAELEMKLIGYFAEKGWD
jgi:hypothetical protein